MRRKLSDKNTRKIYKHGSSLGLTLPIEIIKELGWREKQKVVCKKQGNKIIIKDWKK